MKKSIITSIIFMATWMLWISITYAQFWNNDLVTWYQVPWAWQWTFSDNESTLLDVIQTTVNRVLWMLSLIALLLCLRWWFQMLTAGSDDWKVKSWTKILKNAALWLGIIWLSWLFVSFVFRIINKTTGTS